MKKSVCIICGKEKSGLKVKEDVILGAMRWVERNITRNPKNYELVVCKEDYLSYRKKRTGYERKEIIYAVIGILFLLALAITTRGNLGAIAFGLIITIFMLLLAQMSYIPAVDMPIVVQKKTTNTKQRY